MSNGGFTLLWSKILDSSIWMEDGPTRLTWITMLAMKDKDGIVRSSLGALAHRARVSLAECQKAIGIFLKPDPDDSSKVEQGRRIRVCQGGWQIVNHEYYRYSDDAKREFWRNQKAEQRKKQEERLKAKKAKQCGGMPKKNPPLPGETAYIKGIESGTIDQDGVPIENGGCLSNRL